MRILSPSLFLKPSQTICCCRTIFLFRCRQTTVQSSAPKSTVKVDKALEEFVTRIHGNKISNYDRATRYLEASASTVGFQNLMSSKLQPSCFVPMTSEVFTPGIVYDLISELPGIDSEVLQSLLNFIEIHMNECGLFNYFTDKWISDDVDTTSVCLWALLKSNRVDVRLGKCIAKLISINCSNDSVFSISNHAKSDVDTIPKSVRNVIRTYFPPFRQGGKTAMNCVDPCVMANSLRVLYFFKMHNLALDTQNFVYDWLDDAEKFWNGTNYYMSPDSLLYFLSNCLLVSEDAVSKFRNILTQRLRERIGKTDSPIEISKRIITAFNLGLISSAGEPQKVNSLYFQANHQLVNSAVSSLWNENHFKTLRSERRLLCEQQEVDGSWATEPFYRKDPLFFSNKTAATAFVTKALYLTRNFEKN